MNRPSGISRIIDASRILRVVLAAVVTMVMTGDPIVTVAAETGGGAQAALAAVVSIETRDAGGQLVGVGTGFLSIPTSSRFRPTRCGAQPRAWRE